MIPFLKAMLDLVLRGLHQQDPNWSDCLEYYCWNTNSASAWTEKGEVAVKKHETGGGGIVSSIRF